MGGKKTEYSREKKNMFTFFSAIVLFLAILAAILYCVFDEKTIGLVLFIIDLVGPIITRLVSWFFSDIIKERIERWKIWSYPNLRWYICVIVLIDIVSLIFLIFKIIPTQADKSETSLPRELNNDSIAAVNRQTWFEDKFKEFDSFLKKPLNDVDNNPQIISEGRSVLCQLNDTMTKYPKEFSDKPLGEYINAFNGRVDIAKEFAKTAYNNRLLFDDDTAKYFRRIKEFDKMYFKK